MRRARRWTVTVAVAAAAALPAAAVAVPPTAPEVIALPDGFQPEGIAAVGPTFYVGSLADGNVYAGDLRTGAGGILVDAPDGRTAVGIEATGGLLYVAGGPLGSAYVYDATTGTSLADLQLTAVDAGFVNDVTIAAGAAWFTDSVQQQLYRVPLDPDGVPTGDVETVPITGDLDYVDGFNANGIESRGHTLIIVQSNTGRLFTATTDGETDQIDLGGETVTNGDGILLHGGDLSVVENSDNLVTTVDLSGDLTSGTITDSVTDDDFDVPTTVAAWGNERYVVNARFGTTPTPDTEYTVVRVP